MCRMHCTFLSETKVALSRSSTPVRTPAGLCRQRVLQRAAKVKGRCSWFACGLSHPASLARRLGVSRHGGGGACYRSQCNTTSGVVPRSAAGQEPAFDRVLALAKPHSRAASRSGEPLSNDAKFSGQHAAPGLGVGTCARARLVAVAASPPLAHLQRVREAGMATCLARSGLCCRGLRRARVRSQEPGPSTAAVLCPRINSVRCSWYQGRGHEHRCSRQRRTLQ